MRRAKAGNAEAQHAPGNADHLGPSSVTVHLQGNGVPKDAEMAKSSFELAVSAGENEAMFSLGLLQLRGDGVEQDFTEAAKWAILSMEHDPQGKRAQAAGCGVQAAVGADIAQGAVAPGSATR
jgi:TPR repeat protein